MLICKFCGNQFSDPDITKEYTGVTSEGYAECYDVGHCPNCGSEDYEEAKRCTVCGEWFIPKCVEEVCEECVAVIGKELHALADKHNVDTDTLGAWIASYYEW